MLTRRATVTARRPVAPRFSGGKMTPYTAQKTQSNKQYKSPSSLKAKAQSRLSAKKD